jgi:hypothetical protein
MLANEGGFSFDALNVRLGRSVSDTQPIRPTASILFRRHLL